MAWNKNYKSKPQELTDARLDITMRVLARMKEARDNGVKYQKGWYECEEFPYNPITGKKHTGMNILSLLAYGYSDPRFIPAGEVQKLYKETEGKIRIKKNETSCRVVWAQMKSRGTGETDLETGEEKTISYPTYKYHPTYNVEQLEGLDIINEKFPKHPKIALNEFEECEFVKDVMTAMKATGLKYETHSLGQNFYIPDLDTIRMCNPGLFHSESLYYRTLLHETGHATGHESRCNRNQTGYKGSKDYAYEELCAELYSFYMGLETGVPYDRRTHDNHDAYLNSWIAALSDPKDEAKAKNYLINAASEAFKGFDYTMERVHELRANRGQQNADREEKTATATPGKVEETKPKRRLELAA